MRSPNPPGTSLKSVVIVVAGAQTTVQPDRALIGLFNCQRRQIAPGFAGTALGDMNEFGSDSLAAQILGDIELEKGPG